MSLLCMHYRHMINTVQLHMYIFNTFHARIQKTFRGGGGGGGEKLLCYQRGPRPIFGNMI